MRTCHSRNSHSSAGGAGGTGRTAGIGTKQVHQYYSQPFHGSRQVKNRQVHFCLVDRLQQLLKDLTDSWGVLWAVRDMKGKHRDAGGQLLNGQQGIPLEFLGNDSGGDKIPCLR